MKLILILIIVQLNGQLILYQPNDNSFDYDCLYYRVTNEKLVYQQLSNIITDEILYCFRPMNNSRLNLSMNEFNESYTFEELNLLNISAKELLRWSIPMDLVEDYQYYLNDNNKSHSQTMIRNCSKPWFGYECEYSFSSTEQMSMNRIVEEDFSGRISYVDQQLNDDLVYPLTCYIHLKCDRGEGNVDCLDWREICDGYIDCFNDGIDELNCFEMELNECQSNEYRCHNGLCIPIEFWENGVGESDCLDRSDEYADLSYQNLCYQNPRFRCEEHSCRTNWHRYSCGDGQCVEKFDQCHNGRHRLLIQSIFSSQGQLNDRCFFAMNCLTKLIERKCQSINFIEDLRTCPRIFQFPIHPIDHGHIRFIYENISMKSNLSLLIVPDWICYDQQYCDCFQGEYFHENFTCLDSRTFDLTSSVSGHIWIDMILSINSYFRSCLTNRINENDLNLTRLYQCENSSKFISKHRLTDENFDCCLKDDESDELSCTILDEHRVKCFNESKCLSSLHTRDDCYSHGDEIQRKIPFQSFCNGLEEYLFKDSNGEIHTDETNCHLWPCENIYSRCDGIRTCVNGQDEENCFHENFKCQHGEFPCIDRMNFSLICLLNERMNDERIDCLGSMDEMNYCRRVYPSEIFPQRFRCQNSYLCLTFTELCNEIQSCPHGDDEQFCQNNQTRIIEQFLSHWNENERNRLIYFSLHHSKTYPQIIENQLIHQSNEQNTNIHSRKPVERSNPWPWYCNRGLVIQMQGERRCLCPPSYYGDRCEYQNERISISLGLYPSERRDVYVVILLLMTSDDRIESVDQFEYIASQSCSMKLNRYLLYSTRPKNRSTIYSIRIDIYEKSEMSYRGTWIFSIPFQFLPVNRMSVVLYMPYDEPWISNECLNECEHGQCVEYRNRDESFCHCYSGWFGQKCNEELPCKDCSLDSICIGSIGNHSICICPLMKFGRRCLLDSSCEKHSCLNQGQCIPSEMNLSNKDYSCICTDQYYGSRCEYVKAKLDIDFQSLIIPSYVLAYFLTISNHSEPILTILLQKLTLFQRRITFRIAIAYHLVLIKSNEKYYLAVVQSNSHRDISTTINPSRECLSIDLLFNSTIRSMSRYEQMKFYHLPCQRLEHLNCFYDEYNLCLCTQDHHVNCLEFQFNQNLQCSSKSSCYNKAQCLQDHPSCPSAIICVCTDCFFGNQCQFYAKGLGLTLDQILGYEIKHDLKLLKQSFSVQLSALLTMIMFVIGLINGILSILTFRNKTSQEVGCGIYLLFSSITSLMIVILFTLKFWFLIYSFRHFSGQNLILFSNCMIIEPCLKLLLHIDNWLNACVAGERAFAVLKGIAFNKKKSRTIAKWIILGVVLINVAFFIPQFVYLHLFEDKKEERTWCVVRYSSLLHNYSSFVQFFHFFAPFFINFFSAIFIIIGTTLQRVALEDQRRFTNHFKSKLKQHKHLLISPLILVILSLPRLIISVILDCQKSSKHFWFFLIGYFISFMPSVFIFLVFVLPSPMYKKEFKQVFSRLQRHFLRFNNHSLD